MHAIRPDKRLVRAYCFFSIELGVADLLENILFFLLSTWQGAHQTAIFEYFYILTPERKNCGTDVLTVSRALGHSQSSTTLNIYAHTFSTAQAKASEAIANALPLKPGKGQKTQCCWTKVEHFPFFRKRESPETLDIQGFPGFTTWCGWRDLNIQSFIHSLGDVKKALIFK